MSFDLYSKDNMVRLQDAFVVPPSGGNKGARGLAAGVLDADKKFVEQSQSWTDSTSRVNSAPEFPEDAQVERLNGRYIFGGVLYGHFGHFITESLSRIWALDHVEGKVDGMIFTPKFEGFNERAVQVCTDLGKLLGLNVPLIVARNVLSVEELYVPAQGTGMFDLAEGSQEFRDFMSKHAGADIPAKGGERLYVSRSALQRDRGSILAETKLEGYLAEEGYEIFHPQRALASEQIAKYKAAKYIISVDCSPLHMLAYVGNSEQTTGIIPRRSIAVAAYLVKQLIAMKNMKAVEIDCLVNDWVIDRRPSRRSRGEVDFPKMREALIAAGLIEGKSEWVNPTIEERTQELEALGRSHNDVFVPFKKVTP